MVDLALLQSVSYIAGALGVCVAAFYYVVNLRVQQMNMKNTLETRRIGLVDSITARNIDRLGTRDYFELLRYEWKDYEDFERKYGSENNVEAASTRYAFWNSYNSIGAMLRKGIVEAEDLYDGGLHGATFIWPKYKPVIEEIRRRYFGQGYLRDFEYLSLEMTRIAKERDPSYSMPETLDKYVPVK
jgi:hypothetical protein